MKKINSLTLSRKEVHIWSACFPEQECELPYYTSILSKDELERANSFRYLKLRNNFTLSRGILKCILSMYLRHPPQQIEIIYGLWGKPLVSNQESLHFNLSHSVDYIVYAISKIYEIGIDIEYVDTNLEIDSIAEAVFSRSELDFWNKLPPNIKTLEFFKAWVCKEARLKAYGKGWLSDESHINTEENNQNSDWYPEIIDLIPGYSSALYVVGSVLKPVFYKWNFSDKYKASMRNEGLGARSDEY